jgi:hypothetical protein
MRKAFGIVLGCILLCGLVMAARVAAPSPTNNLIKINADVATDGVDTPWFDWKYGSGDTVQWENQTQYNCQIIFFQGISPISVNALHLAPVGNPNAKSPQYTLGGPPPPPGWGGPGGKLTVYKVYKYQVVLAGHPTHPTFDPGGGPRP